MEHRAIIIVPADLVEWANEQAALLDPDTGGHRTFEHVRAVDGRALCDTRMSSEKRPAVEALAASVPSITIYWESGGWTPQSAMQDAGFVIAEVEP